MEQPNHTMQRMQASRLALSQFGSRWRLAHTADGDRYVAILTPMRVVLFAMLFLGIPALSFAEPNHDQDIQNLAKGTPKETIKASLRALGAAGTAAFPALLANLTNQSPAEAEFFPRDAFTRRPDGSLGPYAPTLGVVCFDIIQGQIEGNWPKGFRRYYVLSPANVKSWLDAHKDLTLMQLRRVSREESLRHAEADLARSPSKELLKLTVAFLRKEVEDMKP
jgi:hypothetical protein